MIKNNYKKLSSLAYNLSKPPGTNIDGDIVFYTNQLIQEEGFVLEAGVGNGRLAIPLLRKGINVIGLDCSKEMLDFYQQNLTHYNMESKTILADLIDFKINQQFSNIIMPNGSFCLIERVQAKKVLANLFHHLDCKGKLYIDLIFPISFKPGTNYEYEIEINLSEKIKILNRAISIDWLQQKTHSQLEYAHYKNNRLGEKEIQNFDLWWYGVNEFTCLLKEQGFKTIKTVINYNNKTMLNLKTLTFIAIK